VAKAAMMRWRGRWDVAAVGSAGADAAAVAEAAMLRWRRRWEEAAVASAGAEAAAVAEAAMMRWRRRWEEAAVALAGPEAAAVVLRLAVNASTAVRRLVNNPEVAEALDWRICHL